MRLKRFLSVGLVWLFAGSLTTLAEASDGVSRPERWYDVLDAKQVERIERTADKISDSIFNAIDDIDLFEFERDRFSVGISVHRRVFDNENVMNTWTVADRFQIDGKIPLATDVLGGTGLGFWLGLKAGIQVVNIRQITPEQLPGLPTLVEQKEAIEESGWYREFSDGKASDDAQWVYTLNEAGNRVLSFMRRDPEHQARYSDLPGLVVLPVKLPLSVERFFAMEDGEITSYVGEGALELGGSIGWNPDPTGVSAMVSLGASYSTYLKGTFRISVLRENARFARVKVTRMETLGRGGSLGATGKPTLLDGVIIIKGLQKQLKIVPFDMTVSESLGRSFDVGYRFDLSTEDGREAYEHAVTGRFSLADQLSEEGDPASGKIFTRTATIDGASVSGGLRLGFVFKNRARASLSNIDAVVTFPDGSRRVLTSVSESDRGWRYFWGVYEKFQNSFRVSLDLDQLEQGNPDEAMSLTMEGKIDDSDTDAGEYLAYVLEMENAVGKHGVFERLPPERFGRRVNLGRSSFYYRVGLSPHQVRKFIDTPKGEMWPALEKAFRVPEGTWSNISTRFGYRISTLGFEILNVPLYVAGFNIRQGSKLWHAEKIRRKWIKLKKISDPRKQAEALGALFYDRLFGYELARLIRQVLGGEQVAYFVSGSVRPLGRITDQGGTTLQPEDIASRLEREIEFDRLGPRPPDHAEGSQVFDFGVNAIDEHRIEIRFRLEAEPRALYFELCSKRWWAPLSNGTLGVVLVLNNGEFSSGENSIVIDSRDTAGPWYPIASALVPGKRYNMRMAINVDGLHWGRVQEKVFRTPTEESSLP